MAVSPSRINRLILDQLAHGEKRVLSLVVAVRKAQSGSDRFKGDLLAAIESALRILVAARAVVNVDGMYSLPSK